MLNPMRHPVRHSRNPIWMVALVCCCLLELSGCSLFVMAGKMIQGDPVIGDEFKGHTGKSMCKSGRKVAVMCSTPEAVKSEFSSLDLDLAAEISRKLALHNIDVIKNHKVANWIDDHGGGDVNLQELGAGIDADLLVQVRLDHFDFREENSPDLFRGKARGSVVVYELVRADDKGNSKFESKPKSKSDADDSKSDKGSTDKKSVAKSADKKQERTDKDSKASKRSKSEPIREVVQIRLIFTKSFDSTYPPLQPISITQMQPETFRKKFLDRVGDELSRTFYQHKPGTDI